MADCLEQPQDAGGVLGRADQHGRDKAIAQLAGEVVEHGACIGRNIFKQLFHEGVIMVGQRFQHGEAGFLLARLVGGVDLADLSVLVRAVDVGALESEVDAAGGDAVLPDRDLAQHQRLLADALQFLQRLLHRAFGLVDLVEEENAGQAQFVQPVEDELQRWQLLGVGFDTHDGEVAVLQRGFRLVGEFNGARAVDDGERLADAVGGGNGGLDAHAVCARFRRGIANRVARGHGALLVNGARAMKDRLKQRRLS